VVRDDDVVTSEIVPPSGTVTFLFTDVEGSTRRWVEDQAAMRAALAVHDELMRSVITAHGGYVFSTAGDSFAAAFGSVARALECAAAAQLGLLSASWVGDPMAVRMGVHVGETDERGGDYFGREVSRAARVMGVANGGQVLLTEAVRSLAPAAAVRSLGEVLLRDFPDPVGVHQLVIDGAGNDFPELRSARRAVGNLRSIPSALVGREQEILRCARLLDESRLVTVTGVGGVGKTRVAHRLAEEAALEEDGAWFIELAAAFDRESVLSAVVSGLGVRVSAGQETVDSIVDSLRARRVLLVLDNCEHVLDEVADLVEEILARCDQIRVLTTSREGLGLASEQVFPLRSIREEDGVRLFVDRAAAAQGGFEPSDASSSQITDLCRRLDGIPLAIELAAARTTTMTIDEVAARLGERFRLLTGSRRRGVERHQTLRAAVEWSYELLDDTERAVFDALGVFVAEFDLAAAEAVCEQGGAESIDVYDGLAALVDKSMLVADTSGTVSQYRMLETLRQYALERLGDGGALDDVRQAHVAYYTQRFEQIHDLCAGPEEHTVLPLSPGFLTNLTSAMTTALESSPAHAVRMAAVLPSLVGSLPQFLIGDWLRQAATLESDPRTHSVIEATLAFVDSLAGHHESSVTRANAVLADPQSSTDARLQALYTLMLSDGFYLGEVDRGLQYRQELLDLGENRQSQPSSMALGLVSGARVMTGLVLGHYDPDALEKANETGSDRVKCYANYAMGFALTATKPDRARALLHDAIEQSERVGNELIADMAHRQLGSVEAIHGQPHDAITAIRNTLDRFSQTGEWLAQWINLQQFTILLHRTGRLEPAIRLLGAASAADGARRPWPTEQPYYDKLTTDAVTQLGQQRVVQLTAEGAALTDVEAVDLARTQLNDLEAELDQPATG